MGGDRAMYCLPCGDDARQAVLWGLWGLSGTATRGNEHGTCVYAPTRRGDSSRETGWETPIPSVCRQVTADSKRAVKIIRKTLVVCQLLMLLLDYRGVV